MRQNPLTPIRNRGTGLSSLACSTIVLAVVAVYSPDDWLRSNLWLVYALQYSFVIGLLLKQRDRWIFFLSPSFLTVSYIALNSCLGAYAFSTELVAVPEDYQSYLEWTNLGWVAGFFMVANFVVLVPYFWATADFVAANSDKVSPKTVVPVGERFLVTGYCVSAILLFSLIDLDLSLFGGSRNFSIIPQALAFLSLVILLVRVRQKGRYLIYILALLYFSSFSSFDKRNAIFLIAPVIFMECINLRRVMFDFRFLIRMSVDCGFNILPYYYDVNLQRVRKLQS